MDENTFAKQVRLELENDIIPFWKKLRDDKYGGFIGYMGFDTKINSNAVKGCILNSRILWFFSQSYILLQSEDLLDEAKHAFVFMKNYCIDKKNGGLYWSVTYDGLINDATKHTYNQAFAIYALSSYYKASNDVSALQMAIDLYNVIEDKCRDKEGYLEAFNREFQTVNNDKLSENGVLAERTMNTLLHVFEAYTELYSITVSYKVKDKLKWMLEIINNRIYNPVLERQEVFFDKEYKSLINLHSYGHDIEASWLIDRFLDLSDDDDECIIQAKKITSKLREKIFKTAYDGESVANECENGVVDEDRVWWVQAESVVGFYNGYQKDKSQKEYLEAAENIWYFIKNNIVDKRVGSEWFWLVDKNGKPYENKPIVEEWKCPYHNGRMCIEIIRRINNAS